MIKYKLNCKNCNITFDSWFANSSEFEKLKKRRLLNCHNCNSMDINNLETFKGLITKFDLNDRDQLKVSSIYKFFEEATGFTSSLLNKKLGIILNGTRSKYYVY